MTDHHQPPDTQTKLPWLHRQWQRVRALWARDIIIGQVGEGATNVIIGKNNVQVNVGGRNLTLPIWLIALLLLAIVTLWVYPLVRPYWNPTRMESTFNIVVTEFGETDSGWFGQRPDVTEFLSSWLAKQLAKQANWGDDNPGIEVWQNDLPDVVAAIQPRLPPVTTAAGAQRLAERRNAHLVIYGDLNRATDPATLTLNFYYKPPPIRSELVDVFAGPQQIGKPVTIANIDTDLYTYEIDRSDHPLRLRTLALIWLAHGLFKDLTGDPAGALHIFQQAETALPAWQDQDGKWLLYFLQGREAFILHQLPEAEEAFNRAINANPQSLNAYIGRANVSYDFAQRGLLAKMPTVAMPSNNAACMEQSTLDTEPVEVALPQSTDEILTYVDRALDDYTVVAQSIQSRMNAGDREQVLLHEIAQWMIGNSSRLKADTYLSAQQFDPAAPALAMAETAVTAALEHFRTDENLGEFALHAQYNLGLIKRAQGYWAGEGQGDWKTSQQFYREAQTEFSQCITQTTDQWPTYPRFFARSPLCSCQQFAADVEQKLRDVEEQQGGDG